MKNSVVFLLASGAFCAVLPLCGQQPAGQSAGPPAVLRIFREDIKEGKGAAHEKTEAAFMQALAKVNYPTHVLGMTAMTGTSQAWFLEGHDTFASIADSQGALDKPEFEGLDAADAQLRTSSRSMLAVYRPDMSFGADKANLPKMRFFSIETIRVREGQGQEFTELAKMLIGAAAKSGDSQPVAAYQVVSGAPDGTYLLLEPTASLKSMDEGPQRQQALFQALGDAGVKRYAKAVTDTIANEESILFAVNPQMSYVPQEWITADPGFWTPKPVTAAKAPAKPPAKKTRKTTSK
jgi:hypothetical protein